MKSIKHKLFAYFSIVIVLFGALVPSATAQEAVITDNASGSTNTVNVTQSNTTNVTQANTADVTNNITTNSNTGDNTANNNNGGDTAIQTGESTTTTEVENSGNISVANVGEGCECPITNSAVISDNAGGSVNTINSASVNNTTVTSNQVANITNNLVTNANTGNNIANNNVGNVSIATGKIFAKTSLLNGPLNISKVKVSQNKNVDRLLKIAGNGVSSINMINNVEINNVTIAETNIATLINNLIQNLNTGGNTASNNNGNVAIDTGDIWSEIKVKNLTNLNEVIVDCGCKPKPGEENPPIIPPSIITSSTSPTGGSNPGPASSSGGSSDVAAAIGNMLPSTGTNWLVLALIGNIMMLFLGAYLRLRSGRSPGLALAI